MQMRLSDLMAGYFNEQTINENMSVSTSELPVRKQKKIDWEVRDNPPRYYKRIKFKDHNRFLRFVVALLQYEDSVKHNAKIIIGYPEVILQVWTHSLENITEMDEEYCREVNSILDEL